MSEEVPGRLAEIAAQVRLGQKPTETVRTLLGWFSASRRGYWVVKRIRDALDALGIRTEPDFEGIFVDSEVAFVPSLDRSETRWRQGAESPSGAGGDDPAGSSTADEAVEPIEPAYRIGRLPAANRPPVTLSPDARVDEAITLMLSHDYSQLPVMTNRRDVKGIVSWRSIGRRLGLRQSCERVLDCLEGHQEIRSESSLFDAIQLILRHDSVLVRSADRTITGIVTASDISFQFRQLAEPFLLIGEIENRIRLIIESAVFSARIDNHN